MDMGVQWLGTPKDVNVGWKMCIRQCLIPKGASTVKWTTLDPCSGLSESDPKLYTNFDPHEIEIHKHLESIWIYKAKWFMLTKKKFQTTYM
jgi:hypothetical protein